MNNRIIILQSTIEATKLDLVKWSVMTGTDIENLSKVTGDKVTDAYYLSKEDNMSGVDGVFVALMNSEIMERKYLFGFIVDGKVSILNKTYFGNDSYIDDIIRLYFLVTSKLFSNKVDELQEKINKLNDLVNKK